MSFLEKLGSFFSEPNELTAEREGFLCAQAKATRTGKQVRVQIQGEVYRVDDVGRAGRQAVLVRKSGTDESTG